MLGQPAGAQFNYNNYNTLLLGLILERATHQPVAEYLQDKLWKPLGMEYPASWSIDSAGSGFELMGSGIDVLTGGTDTHLLQLDLRGTDWTGKDAEERLDEVKLTVNRNTVPFDERPPTVASGVRIGTPAATMRGFDEDDFREVGRIIASALGDSDVAELAARAEALCAKRPLYPGFRGYTAYA